MNPMINLNMVVDKELELERQGFRRTRHWIGDASQVSGNRWFQAEWNPIHGTGQNKDQIRRVVEIKPHLDSLGFFLTRLLNLPNTQRQPARSEG